MDRLRMRFCSSNPQYYNRNFSVRTGNKLIVFLGTPAARVSVERTRDCSFRWTTGESEIKLGQNGSKYKIHFEEIQSVCLEYSCLAVSLAALNICFTQGWV